MSAIEEQRIHEPTELKADVLLQCLGCSETIYPNGLPLPWETQNPTGEKPQEIDE
jgi:hypothetical protein